MDESLEETAGFLLADLDDIQSWMPSDDDWQWYLEESYQDPMESLPFNEL